MTSWAFGTSGEDGDEEDAADAAADAADEGEDDAMARARCLLSLTFAQDGRYWQGRAYQKQGAWYVGETGNCGARPTRVHGPFASDALACAALEELAAAQRRAAPTRQQRAPSPRGSRAVCPVDN
jgi:hypothetical protein